MRKLSTRGMESASYADFRLSLTRTRSITERVACGVFNKLGDGWMLTLDPNALPFYLWLMNHWDGIVEYVMINGQLHLDWTSHWPLGDPTIMVLDDSEWPEVHAPEWEAAEAEYKNGDVIDSVSEGGEEILRVSDSDGIEGQVNEDGESIASDTPSTEIEDA